MMPDSEALDELLTVSSTVFGRCKARSGDGFSTVTTRAGLASTWVVGVGETRDLVWDDVLRGRKGRGPPATLGWGEMTCSRVGDI